MKNKEPTQTGWGNDRSYENQRVRNRDGEFTQKKSLEGKGAIHICYRQLLLVHLMTTKLEKDQFLKFIHTRNCGGIKYVLSMYNLSYSRIVEYIIYRILYSDTSLKLYKSKSMNLLKKMIVICLTNSEELLRDLGKIFASSLVTM